MALEALPAQMSYESRRRRRFLQTELDKAASQTGWPPAVWLDGYGGRDGEDSGDMAAVLMCVDG